MGPVNAPRYDPTPAELADAVVKFDRALRRSPDSARGVSHHAEGDWIDGSLEATVSALLVDGWQPPLFDREERAERLYANTPVPAVPEATFRHAARYTEDGPAQHITLPDRRPRALLPSDQIERIVVEVEDGQPLRDVLRQVVLRVDPVDGASL